MAVAGIKLNINTEELRDLRDRIQAFFPKKVAADVIGDAIKKAIQPSFVRLREITPRGPTLNLQRAVAQKIKKYTRDGAAVGMIGYRRAGKDASESAQGGAVRTGNDRAFHQWWIERGTKERGKKNPFKKSITPYGRRGHSRRVPGKPATEVRPHVVQKGQGKYIASSFNKLGQFKFVPTARGDQQAVQTTPGYPKAFFKASGQPFTLPPVPEGGRAGRPPVQTAWDQTQAQVAETLQRELGLRLSEAWAALRYRDSGTITGTDTL